MYMRLNVGAYGCICARVHDDVVRMRMRMRGRVRSGLYLYGDEIPYVHVRVCRMPYVCIGCVYACAGVRGCICVLEVGG